MRKFAYWTAIGAVCAVAIGVIFGTGPSAPVHGQDKSKTTGKKPAGKSPKISTKPIANTQTLDVKAQQIQNSFVKDAEDLAGQYMEAGHLDKAKSLLEAVLQVNPQSDKAKQKLDQIEESIMSANDFEVDVNPSQGWAPANAMVFTDRPIRFQVDGTYKFDVSTTITPEGFADKDQNKDMVSGIPCGALMGIIVTVGAQGQPGKPGRPFIVGEKKEFTPKETGLLFLRVNAPPGNKNSGKLKVQISGYVKTP